MLNPDYKNLLVNLAKKIEDVVFDTTGNKVYIKVVDHYDFSCVIFQAVDPRLPLVVLKTEDEYMELLMTADETHAEIRIHASMGRIPNVGELKGDFYAEHLQLAAQGRYANAHLVLAAHEFAVALKKFVGA